MIIISLAAGGPGSLAPCCFSFGFVLRAAAMPSATLLSSDPRLRPFLGRLATHSHSVTIGHRYVLCSRGGRPRSSLVLISITNLCGMAV
ncbi:hypothetical protein LA080_007867 [Diaporthe eres]|nr:hypothetical protein LA080_007867 [Diaporthe eres]